MILTLLQLPPPVHGAALRNEEVLAFLRQHAEVVSFDLAPDQPIDAIETFAVSKVISAGRTIVEVLLVVVRAHRRIELVYITPAPGGWGLLRDALLVAICRRVCHLSVVSHFRALGIRRLPNIVQRLLRSAFAGTSAISMSRIASRDIEPLFEDARLHVVPNGLARYSPTVRVERPDGEFRILHLSNLSRAKGTFDALDAFLRIRSEFSNARLTIVGDWPDPHERQLFEAKVRNHNAVDTVTSLGALYDAAKWEVFLTSDVFLFPSTYPKECFPGVVMEAMSAGLPVIAYEHASIPDIIRHGESGWLVQPGDISGLAAGLAAFARSQELHATASKRAFRDFRALYRAEVTHPQLLQVLRAQT